MFIISHSVVFCIFEIFSRKIVSKEKEKKGDINTKETRRSHRTRSLRLLTASAGLGAPLDEVVGFP